MTQFHPFVNHAIILCKVERSEKAMKLPIKSGKGLVNLTCTEGQEENPHKECNLKGNCHQSSNH